MKAGYLQQKGKGVYVVAYQSPAIPQDQPDLAIVDEIGKEFSKFAHRLSNTVKYEKDQEYLIDILVRFLVSMDVYQPDTFAKEIQRNALDADELSSIGQLEEGGQPLAKEDRYMAARFVEHLCATRPELVPNLARIASIGLLTEVVEDFLHPVEQKKSTDLSIIVDAPLALDYLGCSGEIFKNDVRQIFDNIKDIGGKLIVFPITLVEMQRNLQSMLNQKPTERHGPTHEALIRREVSEDFVRAVAHNPQRALENVGFQVRQMEMEHFPHLHKHFSNELYEDFFSSVQWVVDVAPREHDAICMALTMRLREGRNSSDIFQCRYIFATRNPRFVRHSRAYCLQSRLINQVQEGPVIGQRQLATVTWLRTGLGASEAVPRGQLLAACDRVLRVRPEVRDAVVSRLKSFTPDKTEEMTLLLLDQKSLRRLADETLNDETVVTDENAEALLHAVKSAAIEAERKEWEAAIQAERDRTTDLTEKHRLDLDAAKSAMAQVQAQKSLVESRLLGAERDQRERVFAVARMVTRNVRVVECLFLIFLMLIVICGVSNYFFNWFVAYQKLAFVFSITVGLFSLYHQVMNFLGKPKFGLDNILSWLARRQFSGIVKDMKLDHRVQIEEVDFSGGRVKVPKKAFGHQAALS